MFKKMIVVAAMAMLSISAQVGTASANLVNNGDFETGDFTGWTLSNITPLDPVTGNGDFVMVVPNSGNPSSPPNPGNYEAMLGKGGSVGTISQAFATTSGQAYTVSFWLASDGLNTANSNVFQALWNGVAQNLNPVLNPNLSSPYTQYQFTTTATDASSTIAFNFQNDGSVFHLDNVDTNPTPIPAAVWLLGSGLMGLVGIRRKPNT